MHENIGQVIKNTEAVEGIEAKTEQMRDTAKFFQTSSRDLERKFYWRNMKIRCILVTLVIVVILYFLIPMFTDD